jgi:diguanylate cyclase (GGDEF)-like protein
MTQLVDHLAELTEFRDRDALDVTLVGAFHDLLQPLSVAVYRCVGDAGNQRWLTRARMGTSDVVPTSDPAWVDIDSLPRVADHPERWEVFTGGRAALRPGPPHVGAFPVDTGGDGIAILEIVSANALDDAAQRLIRSVLRIYCNFQALLDYSERDSLTGLLNRKTFDTSFLKATAEAGQVAPTGGPDERRAGSAPMAYWLGVIDIDHFKRVNDRFGHLIGDEVLLLLARLMRNRFRVHDRLYRFGGEEFVVLMRCESEAFAAQAFERFRASTEKHAFPQVGHISVSIGFTAVTQGDTPSAAFERADKAVYHAKGNGRNQVWSHAALIASGELTDASKVSDVELF